MLREPGPWIAGLDFPFGQSRRFIENIGWPPNWRDYVPHAASLGKEGFVNKLDAYRTSRKPGDKEHRRETDKLFGAISPQRLYHIPVSRMFFEGAPRLVDAKVTVPGLQQGDSKRIVVEAYPGALARYLIGKTSYKSDTKPKQTPSLHKAREQILQNIENGKLETHYELSVSVPTTLSLADNPSGDSLDALLCAIQAAWSWTKRNKNFGAPENTDPLEGWIANPQIGPDIH